MGTTRCFLACPQVAKKHHLLFLAEAMKSTQVLDEISRVHAEVKINTSGAVANEVMKIASLYFEREKFEEAEQVAPADAQLAGAR